MWRDSQVVPLRGKATLPPAVRPSCISSADENEGLNISERPAAASRCVAVWQFVNLHSCCSITKCAACCPVPHHHSFCLLQCHPTNTYLHTTAVIGGRHRGAVPGSMYPQTAATIRIHQTVETTHPSCRWRPHLTSQPRHTITSRALNRQGRRRLWPPPASPHRAYPFLQNVRTTTANRALMQMWRCEPSVDLGAATLLSSSTAPSSSGSCALTPASPRHPLVPA